MNHNKKYVYETQYKIYIDEFLRNHDIKTASEKARETSMKWFSANSISDFVNESIKEKITKNVAKEQLLV